MNSELLRRRAASIPAMAMVIIASIIPLTVSAADRFALVIGNAEYPSAPLRNPVNDARAVSRALRELGFEVTSLENANKQRMEQAIVGFAGRLKKDSAGLFYYAGHGVQVKGRNYLVPVGAKVESERQVRIETVDVNLVLDEMEYAGSRINIVILDACRNNPFERRMRGGSRGLAAIDAARGTLIAYATAPGSVARDGDGANGLYTEEFLSALQSPGLQVEEVFKTVRVGVARRTRSQQMPWESSSLTGSFVFNDSAKPSTTPSTTEREADLLFWQSVGTSGNPDAYRAYLRQFPQGMFTDLAKIRLGELEVASSSPVVPDITGTATSSSASVPEITGTATSSSVSAPEFSGIATQGTLVAKAQPAAQAGAADPPGPNTRESPYVIAVVAANGVGPNFCFGNIASEGTAMEASRRIEAADGFTFLNRFHPYEDTSSLWTKSGIQLIPIDDEVFMYGRSSNVDGVLVVRYDAESWNCGDPDVEASLYDIGGETRYHRQGDQSDIARMTDSLVDEFAKERATAR